jgi:hypothetical protein
MKETAIKCWMTEEKKHFSMMMEKSEGQNASGGRREGGKFFDLCEVRSYIEVTLRASDASLTL